MLKFFSEFVFTQTINERFFIGIEFPNDEMIFNDLTNLGITKRVEFSEGEFNFRPISAFVDVLGPRPIRMHNDVTSMEEAVESCGDNISPIIVFLTVVILKRQQMH